MNSLAEERAAPAIHDVPLVAATAESFRDYGRLESSFAAAEVEIVTWPTTGWRPVDPDTGNQGGHAEGRFEYWWQGDLLRAQNHAVGGDYVLGWTRDPAAASDQHASVARDSILCRLMNYHPDGGQLFFPRAKTPFVAPLALPGDDLRPEQVVAFYCDGSFGLNIHPGIWHAAVFPLTDRASFNGRQGRVHARISCDFVEEFGCYLRVPLKPL